MKKLLVAIFVLLIPFETFAISASSAIALDLDTGRVLYGYNIHEKRLIASITKIMTAIVAIENSDIEKEVIVTDVIYKAYGSAIYIEVGEKLKIKDLLYGLMLRSGNDAALAIAESVSGSVDEFVYLMNEYKDNLKMNDTFFYNPHGLEENDGKGNISSSYDMALLTRYAMDNPMFREIFKTKEYKVKTNYKTYLWHNKNKLLSEEYINGGKTGFTEKARRTLVTTGNSENINVVVVTLNDPNDWQDHKSIYNMIFNKYKNIELIKKDKIHIKEDKYYKDNKLFVKNDYYMSLSNDEIKKINLNYNFLELDDYVDDQVVGYIEVKLEDKIYHKEPIYIKKYQNEDKENWFQKFKRWLHNW